MAVKGKPVSRESWGREKSRNQPIGLRSAAEAKEKQRQEEGKHTPSLVVGLQDAGLHGAGAHCGLHTVFQHRCAFLA